MLAACLALPTRGSRRRTNLTAGPRDKPGLLVDPIPSDLVTSGPVVDICTQMLPDQPITEVMVNRFTDHEQCGPHQDVNNKEDSFIALDGPLKEAASFLKTARFLQRSANGFATQATA